MAKKRKTPPKATPAAAGVTPERFVRLYRMVQLLAASPQSRETLARRLHLDVRGFYRDLDLLRSTGVAVTLESGRYSLTQDADDALARLPFPDPHLTLGAARTLAKGRSQAHRDLAQSIERFLPTQTGRARR
jgi:predicted DNA-binding transcriptional regulator YafY